MMQRACFLLLLVVTHASALSNHARVQTLQVLVCCILAPAPLRTLYSARRECPTPVPCQFVLLAYTKLECLT